MRCNPHNCAVCPWFTIKKNIFFQSYNPKFASLSFVSAAFAKQKKKIWTDFVLVRAYVLNIMPEHVPCIFSDSLALSTHTCHFTYRGNRIKNDCCFSGHFLGPGLVQAGSRAQPTRTHKQRQLHNLSHLWFCHEQGQCGENNSHWPHLNIIACRLCWSHITTSITALISDLTRSVINLGYCKHLRGCAGPLRAPDAHFTPTHFLHFALPD